jgi:hypothetical protein
VLVVGGAVVALNALVFVNQIRHGGFAEDDWYFQAIVRYGYHGITGSTVVPVHHGPIGAMRELWPLFEDRPLAVVLYGLTHWIYGLHLLPYMALSEGAWLLACLLVYVLLRQLDLDQAPAALIALLGSLFPYGDAVRFWAEGAQSELALCLFLLGAIVAVRALGGEGRPAVRRHAPATLLFLLSVLLYQQTVGLVLAIGILYFWRCRSWRGALARWIPDATLCLLAVSLLSRYSVHPRGSIALGRIEFIYDHALAILAAGAYPFGNPGNRLPALAMLAIAGLSLVVWMVQPRGSELRRVLAPWLALALGGLVWTVGAYAALVPAVGYDPLLGGGENRINFIAQFGDVAFILAVAALTATLVAAAARARVSVTAMLLVFAGLLAGNYLGTTMSDRDRWISAFQAQREILSAVAAGFASPSSHPPQSTIFVGGVPSDYNGMPVFNGPYQLQAGLVLYLHDPTVKGVPVLPGGSLTCTPGTVSYAVYGASASYGHSTAMNVAIPQHRVAVTDSASCALANQTVSASPGLPVPTP